jgi:hypothetical protein
MDIIHKRYIGTDMAPDSQITLNENIGGNDGKH